MSAWIDDAIGRGPYQSHHWPSRGAMAIIHRVIGRIIVSVVWGVVMIMGCSAEKLSHGTFYAAFLSKEFVSVAIESRQVTSQAVDDEFCKIVELDSTNLFYVGMLSRMDDSFRGLLFDSFDLARAAYAASETKRPEIVAEHWAGLAKAALGAWSAGRVPLIPQALRRRLAIGNFAGFAENGDVVLYTVTMSSSDGRAISYKTEVHQGTDPAGLTAIGNNEITAHFVPWDEEATRLVNRERGKQVVRAGSVADENALGAVAIVQSMIDSNQQASIGGTVASVILERGNQARWFRRPAFCGQ